MERLERLRYEFEADVGDVNAALRLARESLRYGDVKDAAAIMSVFGRNASYEATAAAQEAVHEIAMMMVRMGFCFEAVILETHVAFERRVPERRVYVQGMRRGPLINIMGDLVADKPLIHESTGVELRFMTERTDFPAGDMSDLGRFADVEWWRLWAAETVRLASEELVRYREHLFRGGSPFQLAASCIYTAKRYAVGLASRSEMMERALEVMGAPEYGIDEAYGEAIDLLTACSYLVEVDGLGFVTATPGEISRAAASAVPWVFEQSYQEEELYQIGLALIDPRKGIAGWSKDLTPDISDRCVKNRQT
jgi:hypothetical protein